MTAKQLYDLLTDLQNIGMNLSEIHLAYPSQNPATVHERIEHTEIVQLPDEITNTKSGVLKGIRPTEIVFMTDDDKKIYLELLKTEFTPVMVASPGEGAVIVEGLKNCYNCKHNDDLVTSERCGPCFKFSHWEPKTK